MRTRLVRWTVAGLALVGLAVGCSSSNSSTPSTDTSASKFSGIYVTSSEGPLQQFEFVDSTHVNVWWAQCADGEPCQATDTYEVQGSNLVISEPGGNITTLSLAGLEDGTSTQYDPLHLSGSDPLHLEGMGLGGTDAGGSSLGGGSTLSSGDAAVLTQTITIVITFTITIVLTGSSSDAATASSGSGSSGRPGSGSGASGSAGGSATGSGSGGGGHSLSTCSGVVLSQTFKSANTFPNDKTAFDFFRSKGLSADQAAGVVGNLDQESGDSPTCYQGPNGCSTTPVSGYPGAGIAQWSRGGRWDTDSNDNATAFAKQQGTSLNSEQTQLNFIWYELSNKSYGLSTLEQQTSVTGAAGAFASGFEMCGTCAQTKRNQYAQNAYNAFSGDPVSSTDGGMCTPTYGSCSVSSKSGTCVDTSACSSSGGTSTAGKCPGPANIQCCTH